MAISKTNWEWKKLGQITECLDSKRIPVTKNLREKGNVPYYGANGVKGYVKEFIFDEELLLLAEDGGSWGKGQKCVYIIKGKSWVNNHAHVLRMKPLILIKFLEAYLNRTDLNKHISGTTRGKLNQKQMNDIEIPVPPLPVQKRIVSILERAEQLKEKREQANDDTNTIIQSIFNEMFGDPVKNEKGFSVKPLVDICHKITDGSHFTPKILNEGHPFLTVANMKERGFDYVDCRRISKENYEALVKNDCKPLKGDVLFSKDGTVGKVMEVLQDKEEVILSSIALLRPNTKLIFPTFLSEFLKTNFALNQAIDLKSGSGVRRIILKDIKRIVIPLPSLSEQSIFIKNVNTVYSLKEKQKVSTEEISLLFDALMQKAFSGELVQE